MTGTTETVDVQAETIGIGSLVAFALYGYGTFVGGSILGLEATTLGLGVFAATFAAVALLHGAYGRRNLAVAHGGAAIGLALFLFSTAPVRAVLGLAVLVGSGAYIALVTVRAKNEG